jgi:hypothetical protein
MGDFAAEPQGSARRFCHSLASETSRPVCSNARSALEQRQTRPE